MKMQNSIGRLVARSMGAARRVLLSVLIVAAAATGATAQSVTVNNIAIEGNQRVADGTILTLAGIDLGDTLTTAAQNDAVQALRASGLFENVELSRRGNGVLIAVDEYPTINRINIEGNARLRDAQLLTVVQSQSRRVYSPTQAEADTAAITEAYAQQGRINATVTPRIIPRANNQVDLVFEVVESAVTEIERVSFIGNRTFSEGRLRRVLETKQAGIFRAIVARDTYSPDRIAADREVLSDFYRSRGYVDFVIQNVDVALTRERDAYLVTFNIREGQKFEFGNVTVRSEVAGVDGADFEDVIRVRRGATYSPVPIESDVVRLERLALQKGLNFVQANPRITRNERDLSLDLEYVLVSGPRVFVERIDIEGNGTTLDRVIRNQFDVVEGDPFNPREIRDSARRIRGLGFFQNAAVDTRPGSSESQVIVDVDVLEGPTGTLTFGANFNTDTGLGLVSSYRQSNFQGRGQALSFELSTAETNRQFSFGFTEPQLLGRDLSFGLNLSYAATDNENALYDTDSVRLSPSLSFPISENGRLSVFYALEYNDLTDVSEDASQIIQNEANEEGVLNNSVGYSYSFDTRRTGLNPNAGIVLRFGQEFGFGDTQFVKSTALAGAETKLLNEELTLRATLEGGHLSYQEGSSRVTDRFFLGSSLIRGFEAGGIGPRSTDLDTDGDVTDDALGGDSFAVIRLEAEFPLGLPSEYGISGGAFIDYGSVWNVGETFGEDVLYNDFTPRAVAGLSIFWTTPIGPLRFNFTEPLDVQDEDETKTFDVTISTSF